VDDLVPAPAGFQRVHHPKYAAPDNHHPFHFHTLPGARVTTVNPLPVTQQ